MLHYKNKLKSFSRDLRSNQTPAEQILWQYLRRKQIEGIQFSRQKPIGPYIVDFYAKAAKLVIELDGSQHYEEGVHTEYDQKRDEFLKNKNLHVMRFNNLEIFYNLETVIQVITKRIQGKSYVYSHGGYFEL